MNVELLLKVKEQILKEPENFDMGLWYTKGCGTMACIGGWGIQLSGRTVESFDESLSYEYMSAAVLDLDCAQAAELFYDMWWPEPFKMQYADAETNVRRAQVAAERIDAFIAQYTPTVVETEELVTA